MSKLSAWIKKSFNGFSEKIGNVLQDKKTTENMAAEDTQTQVREAMEQPQQAQPQQSQQEQTQTQQAQHEQSQPQQAQSQSQQPQQEQARPQQTQSQSQQSQPEQSQPQQAQPQSQQSQPEQSQPQQAQPQQEKPQAQPRKTLDNKELLLRRVITTLSEKIEYAADINGKKLVIWLDCDDELEFLSYNTDSYRQQMLSTLVNERGFGFEQVMFKMGKPTAELHATKVKDNDFEYLQLVEKEIVQEHKIACKAEISIYGGAGSLKEEKYILSSEDMKEKMITAYNIGAGQFPKIPTGYRENHIAIDDDPNSSMREKNKYVSRMHAHIGYSEKYGFYFQVEQDGTRLVGKRTRIFRGAEKIECDNPQARIPLQSGDLIELGKAVVLRFVQLNEK